MIDGAGMCLRTHRERWLIWALLLVVVSASSAEFAFSPFDDAYFFKRFAHNALEHGVVAWNTGDGPAYGLTSQLFFAVAVSLTRLFGEHYVVAAKLTSAVFLMFTALLLAFRASRLTQHAAEGVVLAAIAVASPLVLATSNTGMETALALLVVTLALARDVPVRAHQSVWPSAAAAVAVYLCRPDAALLPVTSFVVLRVRDRPTIGRYLLAVALLLGACLLAFRTYYGSALPLPFYAKTFGFGSAEQAVGGLALGDKISHALTFLAWAGPFIFIACRRGGRTESVGLLAGAAVYFVYHLVFTQEIMGYRARFYVLALVPLCLAAAARWDDFKARAGARSVVSFGIWAGAVVTAYGLGWISTGQSSILERIPAPAYATLLAFGAWLIGRRGRTREASPRALGALALVLLGGGLFTFPPRVVRLASDDEYLARSIGEVTTLRGLTDVVRCIPSVREVYHSEIGVPGLLLPEARITDLAGLMSRRILLESWPFDRYCSSDRPEAIFLPHRNYVKLNEQIARSDCIERYTRVVRLSSSPLYVRNDLVAPFLACARDVARWR